MTEETFVRELERRADAIQPTSLSFRDVQGRAHRIRRRRRVAAASAVAAAVALVAIIPTVLSGGSGSHAPEPAPPLPAHTAYLHDGQVTLPDGGTVDVDVDNANVSELGVLTDGRIVMAMTKPYAVRVYEPDGTLQEQYRVQANVITMSASDDAVAWVAEDYTVRVLSAGVEEPAELPGIPMPGEGVGSIDAVLDAEHLLVGDYSTTTGEVTPDGYRELTTGEPLRVTDVSPDGKTWAVQYADDADEQFGCAGLYDPESAEMIARSCDTAGLRFAPDGEHLLGMLGDNNMAGEVSTFDLDLEEVGRFDPEGRTTVVSRAAWADADHLLVTTADWQTNTWSLVRVGLDGADPEVVVPSTKGRNPETVVEFLLSE